MFIIERDKKNAILLTEILAKSDYVYIHENERIFDCYLEESE